MIWKIYPLGDQHMRLLRHCPTFRPPGLLQGPLCQEAGREVQRQNQKRNSSKEAKFNKLIQRRRQPNARPRQREPGRVSPVSPVEPRDNRQSMEFPDRHIGRKFDRKAGEDANKAGNGDWNKGEGEFVRQLRKEEKY